MRNIVRELHEYAELLSYDNTNNSAWLALKRDKQKNLIWDDNIDF